MSRTEIVGVAAVGGGGGGGGLEHVCEEVLEALPGCESPDVNFRIHTREQMRRHPMRRDNNTRGHTETTHN